MVTRAGKYIAKCTKKGYNMAGKKRGRLPILLSVWTNTKAVLEHNTFDTRKAALVNYTSRFTLRKRKNVVAAIIDLNDLTVYAVSRFGTAEMSKVYGKNLDYLENLWEV